MGISSCFKGYFIAQRKATPPATAVIIEQAVRITVIFFIIKRIGSLDLESACASVLFGDTVAEAIAALYIFILFVTDQKKFQALSGRKRPPYPIVKQILRISSPITLGRYLNSGLRTIENLLVPKTLAKFSNSGNSLSQFGMIKGMALPLLFFPSALLNSISTLLIPEMSEAVACGKFGTLKRSTEKTIKITLCVGILFGAIFWSMGKEIGGIVYKNSDVGFLICVLAPIVPFMYLDSISDGILKGLDQQLFCFRNSICDSSVRILLITLLLPKLGLYGFIGIMYFSNFLTCFLNVGRLLKVSGAKIEFLNTIVLPSLTALFSVIIFTTLLKLTPLNSVFRVSLASLLSVVSYTVLLAVFGIINLPKRKA
jgi:stage V sporulation protein B